MAWTADLLSRSRERSEGFTEGDSLRTLKNGSCAMLRPDLATGCTLPDPGIVELCVPP